MQRNANLASKFLWQLVQVVTGMSSMSPQMTPWMGATPGYGASSMSPGKCYIILKQSYKNLV